MITFLLISMSIGIMNHIVFPDPVPAMTIASNPRIIASETSICQSYGSLPKRSQNNLVKLFCVLLLSYCVFFLVDLWNSQGYDMSACAADWELVDVSWQPFVKPVMEGTSWRVNEMCHVFTGFMWASVTGVTDVRSPRRSAPDVLGWFLHTKQKVQALITKKSPLSQKP